MPEIGAPATPFHISATGYAVDPLLPEERSVFRPHRCRRLLPLLLFCALGAVAVPLEAAEPVRVEIKAGKGVKGEALENLEAALAPPPGLVRGGEVDRYWVERYARQAEKRAAAALKPFGYYHPRIETQLEEPSAGRFRLRVTVDPGPPLLVESVSVNLTGPGAQNRNLQELLRSFPLVEGKVLRQDRYEEAKGELKARALELGYLDADFSEHRLEVDPARNRGHVVLTLATGEPYSFGNTLIHGAPDYPDRFLGRYLAFSEGERFSYRLLGQTQLNYLNSDRFSDVIITPQRELAEDRAVPVGIQLVPSSRRRLRPGVGYGTDTGARVTLRYKDVNVWRRGHEFTSDFLIAQRRQSLRADYILPNYRHLNEHTALRAGYDQEDIDTYESRLLFVEAEQVHAFAPGRLGSVYLRLLREDFKIGEQDATAFLLLPGIRFTLRRYDDPVRPRSGYQFRLEMRGTDKSFGSDASLMQAIGSANLLLPLPKRFSLFLRGQAGATWQNDPLRDIPPSLRFFAGGDQSVRGYGYQTLGPEDDSGDVVGGKNLLVGSVELERALGEDWGVVLFYDAGNAFDSYSDYEIFEGAGFGVRRYTPVGPVKVDLARQIGVADPSVRLHVSIGFTW